MFGTHFSDARMNFPTSDLAPAGETFISSRVSGHLMDVTFHSVFASRLFWKGINASLHQPATYHIFTLHSAGWVHSEVLTEPVNS